MVETVVLKIEDKGHHQETMSLRFREYDGPLTICLCAFIWLSVDLFSLFSSRYIPYCRCICSILLPVDTYIPRCCCGAGTC